MKHREVKPQKPQALRKGSRIGFVSPSSPADQAELFSGLAELERLGFEITAPATHTPQGYFSGTHEERLQDFCKTFHDKSIDGMIATRGGYGSNYLIDANLGTRLHGPKCLVGFSDVNAIQLLLWQVRQWVTFYGPMVAAGFNQGAQRPGGYDKTSFWNAVGNTRKGWKLPLHAETLVAGECEGRLVGGCLTMVQATIGTGWTPDARGCILLLEDRAMKPYQVDRVLRHLLQAGLFEGVQGFVLGDFPDCDPPVSGSPKVREVCSRILGPRGVPIVYGAPVGHTRRPMLTVPLGIRARLLAEGEGTLEFLEPAVVP